MEIFSVEGTYFLLRWFHFLAGITWIGMLYYFNLVQTPFFATELGGTARSAMVRGLVPSALWWFRWGAMFTFITGWFIILMKLGHDHVPLNSGYITRILTGGLIGTLMWANVWFVIWPLQRDFVIKNAVQVAGGGQAIPEAAAKGALAGRMSRTNTLLSIPMLFFMGSARHMTPGFNEGSNDAIYWILVLAVIAAIELNALMGVAPGRQKYLTTVSGTIHVGLATTLVLWLIGAVVNS